MTFLAVIKMLPYLGVAGLALTAFILFLRVRVLIRDKELLQGEIESLNNKLQLKIQFINKTISDMAVAKKYIEDLKCKKANSDALLKKVQNAKNDAEIFSIINNHIKLQD